MRRDPVPYLLAVAMASNVGSDRDDHRQSAEHHDRQLFAYPLWRLRRGARAGRAVGARVVVAVLIVLLLRGANSAARDRLGAGRASRALNRPLLSKALGA